MPNNIRSEKFIRFDESSGKAMGRRAVFEEVGDRITVD
jgi:hypothetical protein